MFKHFTAADALQKAKTADDREYGILLKHNNCELGYYKPDGADSQDPHDRDEVYVVESGSGFLVVDGERKPFEAGDALFVPAFVAHRFEEFTDDFATWVIFVGPDGGEARQRQR